eukprot:COSAG06_NODE_52743_length_304_cov_0.634146_1_plen_73_part_10
MRTRSETCKSCVYRRLRSPAACLAHKKTTAQVALRWVVQQQVVAVTSAKNAEYAKEDLNIFDFALTASEMAEL